MRERFFEAGHKTEKQLIQRDVEDSGVSSADEWRDALDLDQPLEGEDKIESININFDQLFEYVGNSGEQSSDLEKIDTYKETEHDIQKLEILRTLSVRDAVTCLRDYSDNPAKVVRIWKSVL